MLARCQAVMADCTKALCQCPAVSLWLAMNINQLCVHAYVCVFLSCLSLSPLIHWNPMCVSLWMSVHITMFSSFRGSRVRRSEHVRTPSHPQIIWDSRRTCVHEDEIWIRTISPTENGVCHHDLISLKPCFSTSSSTMFRDWCWESQQITC